MTMPSPIKTVQVEGEFLSPVHVGWGRELDPFSCFIQGNRLYLFEMSAMIQALSPEDRLQVLDLINKNSLVEIRQYLAAKANQKKNVLGSIAVSESLSRQYADKMGDPKNQLLFQPFFRNSHSFHPVLPGSSLKGAIRTAVIDTLIHRRKFELSSEAQKNPRRMEMEVLGHQTIDQDPFKAIKCEDIDLEPDSTILNTVFNYSPKREKLTDLGLRCETTHSCFDQGPVSFRTSIHFFTGYKDKIVSIKNYEKNAISMYLEPEYILTACRQFFLHDLEEEHQRFYRSSSYEKLSTILLNAGRSLANNECLIRVGRFTQAESKSINKYRTVMVRGRQGSRPMPYGTTRNLAAGKYPMGWIKLRFKDIYTDKIELERRSDGPGQEGQQRPQQLVTSKSVPQLTKQKDQAKQATPTELSKLADRFRVKKKK